MLATGLAIMGLSAYAGGGALLGWLDGVEAPYAFLSIADDPVLNDLIFGVGVFPRSR